MKINFVITQLGGGGAERVVSLLAEYFASLSHDVTIICTSFNGSRSYKVNESIKIISLVGKDENFITKAKKLRKIFYENRPDIIVSFLPNSDFLIYLSKGGKNSKIISSERNSPLDSPKSFILRMLRWFGFMNADQIVFQSDGAKRYFSKKIQKKSVVIPNPIVFDKMPTPKPEGKRIIAVGRIVPQKNYSLLLSAFKIFHRAYPDYTLSIFGRDCCGGYIENLINKFGLDNIVIHQGFSSSIWNEISKSSVFCLSSDFEGLPNALLEASAIGIPVISTDWRPGGARDVIDSGNNGLVVPVGDAEAYAKAMCNIVKDIECYRKRAFLYRQVIRQKFDIRIIGNEWIHTFEYLLREK